VDPAVPVAPLPAAPGDDGDPLCEHAWEAENAKAIASNPTESLFDIGHL
jgi:hypothetical protein